MEGNVENFEAKLLRWLVTKIHEVIWALPREGPHGVETFRSVVGNGNL